MKPAWNITPALAMAASIASVSSRVSAMGFSQKIGFPASAAAITTSRCVPVGEVTKAARSASSASRLR
jgi:hypothetical protein